VNQNPPKILLIDDETSVARVLGQLLKRAGYSPLIAFDGVQGHELALSEIPALIICDERMPVMDGQETLRRLKENPITAHIPVIMIGGSDMNGLFDWRAHGAAGFVAKPFDVREMLALLRQVLLAHETSAHSSQAA
jgi:two-component system, OmpR family, alkaline phosphatase synthesis response regulator PhoP